MTTTHDLNLYLHPELSLLSFNERVLSMALEPSTPLLERLKYLCIFSSNMDEFFEIRVSGLMAKAQSSLATEGVDGLTPQAALDEISETVHRLVDLQYDTLNDLVFPELEKHGIRFLAPTDWNELQAKWLKTYFKRQVLPLLTPIRIDPARPFPLTINKGLSIVVDLHEPERDDAHHIAVVPAPRSLPRFLRLPAELCDDEYEYVYLSAIIHAHIEMIFSNVEVLGCHQFRITRNSDLYVDPEEVEDLARALEGELPSRLYGEAIRLEVSRNCPKRIVNDLQERFGLEKQQIYKVNGPVNLNRLFSLPDMVNRPQLKFKNFTPSVPAFLSQQASIFDTLSNTDVLLHHPYQSFAPVVDLLRQAAIDPDVLVVKQTLYRTGANSIMAEILTDAARAGKEVTVVIELMARFDEQNNLTIAEQLQAAGAHVVYGMVGMKTHAKMLLIVRRERGRLKRYVHLGTGNYHQGNTRIYTDYGLMTSDKGITQDVHEIFMQLTTQGPNAKLTKLYQSPYGISAMLVEKIQREIDNAKSGKNARIIAKTNALSSPTIINALYEASQAGVKIDLIVRGICCLRPGLKGISENIKVRSIVGRFLEHERVYYFENDGYADVFLSSADLMPRNLVNRIEQCTPIESENLKTLIINELEGYLNNNYDGWIMSSDGTYSKQRKQHAASETEPLSAQQVLLQTYAQQE